MQRRPTAARTATCLAVDGIPLREGADDAVLHLQKLRIERAADSVVFAVDVKQLVAAANDLFITGGLHKVLDMIERRYGISFR